MQGHQPNEKRAHERLLKHDEADVHLADLGSNRMAIPAVVTDCSPAGVGLVLPEPLAVGTQFYLQTAPGVSYGQAPYTVVHCRKIAGGHFALGTRQGAPRRDPADDAQST